MALLLPISVFAQPETYNHPELKWEVYESEHFQVIFHQGTERTARELLRVAEDIYEPVTTLYDYEPDSKIRILVRDHDDYSNAGAYYYDNKILVWAKPMDWVMRGTHNWARNGLTHEFSHMMQLGASRKLPRWLPAFYFQWIDYEEEKRPDVLYGYPNVLASYPLPMTIIPPWFAEGCAQYQAPGLGYDHWDSHRDMILRMRTLDDNLLSYTEMGYYGKTSYDAEGVYDHGFLLVRYLTENWGPGVLKDLSDAMQGPFAFTFDQALKRHIGMNGKALYRQWVDYEKNRYLELTESIRDNLIVGEIVADEGFANLNPVWDPAGQHLAFTSNRSGDYFMHSGLAIYDAEKEDVDYLEAAVGSQLSWSPDSRFVFYSKQFGVGKNKSHFNDLAAWDREQEEELRLTEDRRASYIDVSSDGERVCFTVSVDGTQNLWIADLPEKWWEGKEKYRIKNEIALTHYANGELIYTPRWSPDGKRILFAYSRDRNRDILSIDVESGEISTVISSVADDRDAVWASENEICFSSDRTGIFNLFRYSLSDSTLAPVSNTLGGAFMPAASKNGQVALAHFTSTGYKIALMDEAQTVDAEVMTYIPDYTNTLPEVNYPTDEPPVFESRPYKPIFDRTFIVPRLAVNFGTFMPGIYFYFQDVLEQMSAFGGFSINHEKDYDLFALLDYRKMHPTIFLEAYNVVRHTSQTFEDPFVIVGEIGTGEDAVPIFDRYAIDYHFNLIEVDGGFRLKLSDNVNLRAAGILSRYRTTLRLDDGLAFGYTYFKGKAGELTVTADLRQPGRHQDICPTEGLFVQAKAAREYNDFIDGFEVNADKGTLQEVYTRYTYNRFELLFDRYLSSPLSERHGITLTGDAGFLDESDVDDFFYLYAGGFDGMRGYSFYSLGGTRRALLRGTYCFPLWSDAAKSLGIVDLDKIYLQVYGDIGNAWVGDFDAADLKKDFGISLKTQLYSFTTFPTAVSIDAAYGFDKFQVDLDDAVETYGEEWRFYFTVLFNFNLRHAIRPNELHR
jgi:Tol biopolymer transport system component